MGLLNCLVYLFALSLTLNLLEGRAQPCIRQKHSKISKRHEETGFSIQNDCEMFVSHPDELGGGHESVFVDKNGHMEETKAHIQGLAKDSVEQHHNGPVDGPPIKFRTDEHDLHSFLGDVEGQ